MSDRASCSACRSSGSSLIAILVTVLLSRTNFGNWVRATGGFLPAAQSMGIPTARVKIACFMLCSVLAGFAGTIQVMRLGAPLPSIGEGLELQAVAAAVIGGASLSRRHRHDLRRHHRRGADPRDRQRAGAEPGRRELVQDGDRPADDLRGGRERMAAQARKGDQGGDLTMSGADHRDQESAEVVFGRPRAEERVAGHLSRTRRSASSATTAPASRRSSTSCPASRRPTEARSGSRASRCALPTRATRWIAASRRSTSTIPWSRPCRSPATSSSAASR